MIPLASLWIYPQFIRNYENQSSLQSNQSHCRKNHNFWGMRERQSGKGKMGLQPLQQTTYQCRKVSTPKGSKICHHPILHTYNPLHHHYHTLLWLIKRKQPFGKTDCMEYYAKVKDVLTKFTNKSKPITPNSTKEESKVLNNLKKMMTEWSLLPTKELP